MHGSVRPSSAWIEKAIDSVVRSAKSSEFELDMMVYCFALICYVTLVAIRYSYSVFCVLCSVFCVLCFVFCVLCCFVYFNQLSPLNFPQDCVTRDP